MNLKRCLTIWLVLSTFCLAFPMISQAECSKFCRISSKTNITFMMNPKSGTYDSDQRRGFTHLASFKAEGHYGGGCKTSVGRQKARKRACSAAKKLAQKAYSGKPDLWKEDLCKTKAAATGKYSLLYFRKSGGKIYIVPHEDVKWIKINRIDFFVVAEDGTTRSVKKKGEFTLKSSGEKFACKDGKPVPFSE